MAMVAAVAPVVSTAAGAVMLAVGMLAVGPRAAVMLAAVMLAAVLVRPLPRPLRAAPRGSVAVLRRAVSEATALVAMAVWVASRAPVVLVAWAVSRVRPT